MRNQVAPSPIPGNFPALLPVLREHAFAINTLIGGLEVVATADLPAASADLDGLTLIENAGGSTRNLVIYTNGLRTRFTGTNF